MLDGIVSTIKNKPRTTVLFGLLATAGIALLTWDAQRGGTLYAYTPFLLCLAMHGLMHGRHGGHRHGTVIQDEEAPKRIPVEPHREQVTDTNRG